MLSTLMPVAVCGSRRIDSDESFAMMPHGSPSMYEALPGLSGKTLEATSRVSRLIRGGHTVCSDQTATCRKFLPTWSRPHMALFHRQGTSPELSVDESRPALAMGEG